MTPRVAAAMIDHCQVEIQRCLEELDRREQMVKTECPLCHERYDEETEQQAQDPARMCYACWAEIHNKLRKELLAQAKQEQRA